MTRGSLLIRDADETYALTTPTIISGQHDTGEVVDGVAPSGAVTEGVLTTPVVSFETVALGLPVFVDATLTQVTPGSGTGVIDADGNVQFRTSMHVRLDIDVPSANLQARCETSPVELVLDSTAPYDPNGAKRVTLRDPDFSVPAVPVTDQCISIVANNVNDLLAGGGHSLTMTFGGDLTLPPKADCPTLTELVVSPVDEARFGTEVTLTGTVSRDPAGIGTDDCDGAEEDAIPTGLIEFRDGNNVIGTGEVDPLTGVATLVTDDLPAGDLDLSAAYRSSPPFAASSSAVTPYRVTADPAITADLPSFLRIGAAPTEFDVTVTNSPLGADIANGRLTLTVAAPESASNLTVEYQEDNGTWTSVPVTPSGTSAFARIDPLVGRAIDAGEEVTRRVRVAAANPSLAGPYQFIFELIQVDPVSGLPAPQRARVVEADPVTPGMLGTTRGEVAVVGASRLTPTWTANGVQPHTIRQGQTVRIDNVGPIPTTIGAIFPTGAIRVLFDGQPVPVRLDTTPTSFGYLPFLDKQASNNISPEFVVPVNASLGDRTVTLIYEGDEYFAPAQLSYTVRVLAARGVTYTCASSLVAADRFTVNVEASAIVPAAGHPGDEVDLGPLDISLFADRGGSFAFSLFLSATNPIGVSNGFVTIESIGMELAGNQGSGTAGALTTANAFPMFDFTRPEDPAPDAVFGFDDETASVTLQGEPGGEVPVTLDRIRVTGTAFLSSVLDFDCVPLGDPVTLGTIKLAGAALTVDAPDPARVGDMVTLTTQVHPIGSPGLVEFFDGATSLGLVAVDSLGLATLQTDTLPQGTRQLKARFFGGVTALSSTTEIVVLEVLVATECAAFAEEGDGAVVRLVYMELLGRCPDQAGYDYWVGRLDGGLAVDAFARIIARTPEAVGRVVDDAYRTMLGRPADAPGRTFWTGRLQAHGRYDTLLADLGASPEFWTKAGSTNTGFVTRVYEQLLNRVPDQAGQDYWTGRLDAGTSPRALILSLANLDEPLGVLVADSYDEILSRAPSAGERTNGIAFLRRTGDRSGLYAQLIGTQEFADRAQGFPNPED